MQNKFLKLALVALGGRALMAWQRHALRNRPLTSGSTKHKPPALQTWEGEGGALRTTGAQLGPDPSVSLAVAKDQAVPINVTH